MPYVNNRQSIYPLTPAERNVFLSRVKAGTWELMKGLDPQRVVLFLYHTGAHPDLLVHPRLRMLHYSAELNRITWSRPKTDQTMSIPAHPDIRAWVGEFVEQVIAASPDCRVSLTTRRGDNRREGEGPPDRPYCFCYQRIGGIVKKVTRDSGFPDVTARTLRHCFAARIYQGSNHDLTELKMKTGTTASSIALRYAESDRSELDEKLERGEF